MLLLLLHLKRTFGLHDLSQKIAVIEVLLELGDLGFPYTGLFAVVGFGRLHSDNLNDELVNFPCNDAAFSRDLLFLVPLVFVCS